MKDILTTDFSNHSKFVMKKNCHGYKYTLKHQPVHVKTNNLGFRPTPTQTRPYSHRIKLEA